MLRKWSFTFIPLAFFAFTLTLVSTSSTAWGQILDFRNVPPSSIDVEELTPFQSALSFEDPSEFEVVFGQGGFSGEDTIVSDGNGSLQLNAGFTNVQTPQLSTSEFPEMPAEVTVDLWVGSDQPNPYWVGALQVYVHAPSANLYNQYLGQTELTGVAQDEFVPHTFDFPPYIAAALVGDVEDVQFRFVLNTNQNSGPYFIDNIVIE